jgi:hypothetical protein
MGGEYVLQCGEIKVGDMGMMMGRLFWFGLHICII